MNCPKCGNKMIESTKAVKRGILKYLCPCCFFQGQIVLDTTKKKITNVSWINQKGLNYNGRK